ncbi:kinetochore Sim4 complex subunit FTA2-domain-containing protein [Hypomontagnella monticulosa]|nr:kinetochore Sim4 complex subunit FTA2-domain-containing protein [Hypomontagnella monticulosa]
MPHTMYPDWPRSSEDLVPLPLCDGPKLKPFDFQGAQKIEFLEYIGEGLHAHVFKVQIRGQTYALKLFRFLYDHNWLGPASDTDPDDRALMSAFYDYAEPFSCECRAFGRLQEAGHEDLAVDCFGYILLDEEYERELRRRFPKIDFTGDIDYPRADEMRSRFLGRDGREPPIRGIVKEFRQQAEDEDDELLQPGVVKEMLGNIGRLQQLGIIRIDVAPRQLVRGKITDFSTAITVPHFVTTPELNPGLTREMRDAMELETFRLSLDDYLAFDEMMHDWNVLHADEKGTMELCAFPGGNGSTPLRTYNLRNKAAQERVFTYVDPRRYDWKRRTKGTGKRRRRLRAKPRMWVYYCGEDSELATMLRRPVAGGPVLQWDYKDGLIFPRV